MPGPILLGTDQTLDESLNTIISTFKLKSEEVGTFRTLATPGQLTAHSGRNKEINKYSILDTDDQVVGVDIQKAQDITDSRTVGTPNEVGGKVIIPFLSTRRAADPDFLSKAGKIAATSYRSREDRDGADQLDSFTPGIGATGNLLSPGLIGAMAALMRTGNTVRTGTNAASPTTVPEPAPMPWYGVFHPFALENLWGNLVPLADAPDGGVAYDPTTAGGGIAAAAAAAGSDLVFQGPRAVGLVGGIPIYDSANIIQDGNGDAGGYVFAQEAFNHLSEIEVTTWKDWSNSMRAWEVGWVGSYTYYLYNGTVWGVDGLFDAASPIA